MSDTIITVENLSKKYLVGHKTDGQQGYGYTALRDVVGRGVRSAVRKTIHVVQGRQILQGNEVEEFWALKDVSFEVERGEVLGVIGRNGAGKSTLLKILSRITEPTRGRVTLRGRVSSLLEVGTGFHPELTGRENIFLNGAILGMSRHEIRKKFDEIIAFAEVEKFVDTPVKHYSSGMYVRLAFSVAAHLEPDILIVDEVLAVGDAEFQKKCLGILSEAARGNRTILFVSHNMSAIKALTERCILLDHGGIAALGKAESVVAVYLEKTFVVKAQSLETKELEAFRRRRINDPSANIVGIGIVSREGEQNKDSQIRLGATSFTIRVHLLAYRAMQGVDLGVQIKNSEGDVVTSLWCSDSNSGLSIVKGGQVVNVVFNNVSLVPGLYFVTIGISPKIGVLSCDIIDDYPLFTVVNTGQITRHLDRPWGMLHCSSVDWRVSSN